MYFDQTQDVFANLIFFSSFQNISKTIRVIDKTFQIKSADLLIYNNFLAGLILISLTVF